MNNGLNIEENFFRYARELLSYDHAPAYFMYANLYARKIKDERLPDKTAKWFYEKAKALEYPPAVNLERVWDSQTIILAKALGFYTEEEGPKETPEARENRIFMELYEEGKYFNLLRKLQEGAKLPTKLSMRELLYNATKEMIERVGEDGNGYRRANSCPSPGSIEEYGERDYIMNDLRLLASFNEPMAYYLMALCPGNPNKYRSILSNYNDARNCDNEVAILRIYTGVTESWKRRNYSYYFDGPMPESMWRKYESQIRIITQKYHAFYKYRDVIDIFKKK